MKKSILTTMMGLLAISISAQQPVSPNGRLSVDNTAQGFSVSYLQQPALHIPVVGYEGVKTKRLKWRFSGLKLSDYHMISGKKEYCSNDANEYRAKLNKNLQLVLRL